MFCHKIKPLTLVVMIGLSLPNTTVFAQDNVVKKLIYQGYEWHDQGRDELAAEVWQKILSIEPNQPDALLGLGLADLSKGNKTEAMKELSTLKATHNGSSQYMRLHYAVDNGIKAEANALQDARRYASAGQYQLALRHYETVFQGKTPSPDLAVEYYQCLAGSKGGYNRAAEGMKQFVEDNPESMKGRLAYAEVLTYDESGRREGIEELSKLSAQPEVGTAARDSWKKALLWLNATPADIPLYNSYLASNPNDSQILKRIDEINHPKLDATGLGFKALNTGNVAAAEQNFQNLLKENPNDANALGGLGTIRLRQKRFSEAVGYLTKANAASPKWSSALKSAKYWDKLQKADIAEKSGNKSEALRLLNEATALDPKEITGILALADLQKHSDNASAAESAYKRALAISPTNSEALQGLANLYAKEGRLKDAQALLQRLPMSNDPNQMQQRLYLESSISRGLAEQAMNAGDFATAQRILQQSVANKTADPWARLDLARLYVQSGRQDQAKSVMSSIFDNGQTASALYANALYNQQIGDWDAVRANLNKIPMADRTEDMAQLDQIAYVQQQARQARYLATHDQKERARELLSTTESNIGSEISQTAILAALAGAYADAGDTSRAMVLAKQLIADMPNDTDARLQYAEILLRAHQTAQLQNTLNALSQVKLTPDQQKRYQDLRMNVALNNVDTLREEGNFKDAEATLAPLLVRNGDSIAVRSAQARLYSSEGKNKQALEVYKQILQHNPDDVPTLVAAANCSAADPTSHEGVEYAQHALQLQPDSPEVLAAAGRVYRAHGEKRKAEAYFQKALVAQQQGPAPGTGLNAQSQEDVSNELQSLQEQSSNSISVAAYERHHSGDKGLDKLTDQEAIIQGNIAAGNGNVVVNVTPTRVDNAKIENAYKFVSEYGGGPRLALQYAVAKNPAYAHGTTSYSYLNHILLTQSSSVTTQEMLVAYAKNTGAYQSVRSHFATDALATANLLQRPFYAFFMQNNASNTPIASIASAILNNPQRLADLAPSDRKILQALSKSPSLSKNTPAQLMQMLAVMSKNSHTSLPMDHRFSGVGFGVTYKYNDNLTADIGSTPTGFPEKRIVGGVSYAYNHPISEADTASLGVSVYRRIVPDNMLSFAGMRDSRTGIHWGGVTNNGIRLSVGLDQQRYGSYFNISYGRFLGNHVADNKQIQGNIGMYFNAYKSDNQAFMFGGNIMAMRFDKNLSGYTYGHGAYFSPQSYVDFLMPFTWNGRTKGHVFAWRINAMVGVQHWHKKDTIYFPTDPTLQAQAEEAADLAVFSGVAPYYIPAVFAGETKTTGSYRFSAAGEWQLSPRVFLGTRGYLNNARGFHESNIDLYMRVSLDHLGAKIDTTPLVLSSPYYTVP